MKTLNDIAVALVLIAISLTLARAGDTVETLPSAIYQQMKHEKKLDKEWISADFDKSKGFKVNAPEYKAEYRNGTVMDYMPKALATLSENNSPNALQVTITKVS